MMSIVLNIEVGCAFSPSLSLSLFFLTSLIAAPDIILIFFSYFISSLKVLFLGFVYFVLLYFPNRQ